MIVTHTRNAQGQCRVYLGGKSSLECWVEPKVDGIAWGFNLEEAVTGNHLSDQDRRASAIYTLFELAKMLGVAAEDLAAVPFEAIAVLHSADPYLGRRIASSKRRSLEQGFMSVPPGSTRPRADFMSAGEAAHRPKSR